MKASCPSYNKEALQVSLLKMGVRSWSQIRAVTHNIDFFKILLSIFILTGSGVALMSNFEQLLRGVWRPETNEILNMSL